MRLLWAWSFYPLVLGLGSHRQITEGDIWPQTGQMQSNKSKNALETLRGWEPFLYLATASKDCYSCTRSKQPPAAAIENDSQRCKEPTVEVFSMQAISENAVGVLREM